VRSLAIAIQFLTRIPVRVTGVPSAEEVGASLNYYPLVGLLIGIVLAVAAWALQHAPTLLGAVLLTVLWVVLTGALHLDGLADSADAWVGGLGDKEKTLRIMKDPACGPAGVVAIVSLLLLKVASLHSLIQFNTVIMIFVAPMLARTAVMLLVSFTPYVRSNGLGTALKQYAKPQLHLAIAVLVIVVLLSLIGKNSLFLVMPLLAVIVLLRYFFMQRLGGITGDLAGAAVEISELTVLLSLLAI